MGLGSITNTNPTAWGLPVHGGRVHPDRTIVPGPKPFEAAPGVVPYHRYLQAQNQLARLDTVANTPTRPVERGCDRVELSQQAELMAPLLPKLGEVLPVTPPARQVPKIIVTQQQVIAATGRLLDQFA